MTAIERDWQDVMERLNRAAAGLREMARQAPTGTEHLRLRSKAAGIDLAYDYLRGYGHHKDGSGVAS